MEFKRGPYSHMKMKDVFVLILQVNSVDEKGTNAFVQWWNKGSAGQPYPIGEYQSILIKPEHYKDWSKHKGENDET